MLAFKHIANRLDGSDGRPGNRFNPTNLDQVFFDNRSFSAELVADALIALCRSTPSAAATNGPLINLVPACTVLANWNKRSTSTPWACRCSANSGAGRRFPFSLSLLIFQLALMTLPSCHRYCGVNVAVRGFPVARLARAYFARSTFARRL